MLLTSNSSAGRDIHGTLTIRSQAPCFLQAAESHRRTLLVVCSHLLLLLESGVEKHSHSAPPNSESQDASLNEPENDAKRPLLILQFSEVENCAARKLRRGLWAVVVVGVVTPSESEERVARYVLQGQVRRRGWSELLLPLLPN